MSGSPRGTVGGGVGGNGVDGKFAGSAPKSTWRHTGLPDDDDHPVGNVWDAAALMFFSQDYSFLPGINVSDGWEFSAPVGRFRPNNFGLSDLPGNVGAWCFDWSKFQNPVFGSLPSRILRRIGQYFRSCQRF